METLNSASQKAIQNLQTRPSGNTLQTSTQIAEQRKTQATIAQIVRQSYDIFDVFGKTGTQFKTILMAFDEVLKTYPAERVEGAFMKYLETGTVMPKPANIKNILDGVGQEQATVRAEYKEMKTSPDVNDWQNKTDAEKAEHDAWFKNAMKRI